MKKNTYSVNIRLEGYIGEESAEHFGLILEKDFKEVELKEEEKKQIEYALVGYFSKILNNENAFYTGVMHLKFLLLDKTLADIETLAEDFKQNLKKRMIEHYNKFIKPNTDK